MTPTDIRKLAGETGHGATRLLLYALADLYEATPYHTTTMPPFCRCPRCQARARVEALKP